MDASPAAPPAAQPVAPVPIGPDLAPLPFRAVFFSAILAALILACWFLPRVWYSKSSTDQPMVWFDELTNAPGWTCELGSVDKSAEARLAADSIFYATFSREGAPAVRLFTAKRYRENPNEIGLFVHTPDRCWTESGWRIESADPDTASFEVGGIPIRAERRVFEHPQAGRELVYFFGTVGGQALPYRLDHNFSVGRRFRRAETVEKTGVGLRASDSVFWQRVWDAFRERRQLFGSKQLVRISTAVSGNDVTRADAVLREALGSLLVTRRVSENSRP